MSNFASIRALLTLSLTMLQLPEHLFVYIFFFMRSTNGWIHTLHTLVIHWKETYTKHIIQFRKSPRPSEMMRMKETGVLCSNRMGIKMIPFIRAYNIIVICSRMKKEMKKETKFRRQARFCLSTHVYYPFKRSYIGIFWQIALLIRQHTCIYILFISSTTFI